MWWNRYIELPFKEHGRDENGLDCWGLVRMVYKQQLGIDLPSYVDDYTDTLDKEGISPKITERAKQWREIEPKDAAPFDVIVMVLSGVPMHVGLVTKRGFMLHCSRDVNVTHEPYTQARWGNRVKGIFRHE